MERLNVFRERRPFRSGDRLDWGLRLKSYNLAGVQDCRLARKFGKLTDWKEGELCQEHKDKLGERSVAQDVLRVALNAKRGAKDEGLPVRYGALDGGRPGRIAARHARLPAVCGAQAAG
jgi:hypothetical protein